MAIEPVPLSGQSTHPFFQDHFFQSAIDAGVEKALSDQQPVAYGVGSVSEVSLDKAIAPPHDANYALLYALYKLNTDVSGCVHKRAGGVTGSGWRITTMDADATLSPALEAQMQEIERWRKNPDPSTLFASMLYEVIQVQLHRSRHLPSRCRSHQGTAGLSTAAVPGHLSPFSFPERETMLLPPPA